MTEFITFINPVLERHGWPTVVLLVMCLGLFWACRWAAPRIDGWISKVVNDHCLLIESLRDAIDAIKSSLVSGKLKYDGDVTRTDQTLVRIEGKLDDIKEVVQEIKHAQARGDGRDPSVHH